MGDIVDALRTAYGPNPLEAATDEIELLTARIERLHALIDAWADADDETVHPEDDDEARRVLHARIDTTNALRKAVGR